MLAEEFGEVGAVAKVELIGDLRDREIGVDEQPLCLEYDPVSNEIAGSLAYQLLADRIEMIRRHM